MLLPGPLSRSLWHPASLVLSQVSLCLPQVLTRPSDVKDTWKAIAVVFKARGRGRPACAERHGEGQIDKTRREADGKGHAESKETTV